MTKVLLVLGFFLSQIANASKEVYFFSEDGGEHAPYVCEKKSKSPLKLTKNKEMAISKGYLGSRQTEFADKNEAGINAWNHYFSSSADCEKVLKKINKEYSE